MNSIKRKFVFLFSLIAVLLVAWYSISRRASGSLVVYCTHDLVYAEPVL